MRKLLLLLMALLTLNVSAITVEIDGVRYELQSDGNVAELKKVPSDMLGSFVIPEYVEYEGAKYVVTTIGSSALAGCKELVSVTIPNSVTSIGNYAFQNCSYLLSIDIPNSVTYIGTFAFSGCSSMISATIPNNVTVIKDRTFEGCSSLTSIAIPKTIREIERLAFYKCQSLNSVFIEDIEAWCNISFHSQMNIQNIVYDYSNPLYYANHLYLNGEEVTDLVIPNGVTSIKDYAFLWCLGLKSVTIPNSVKSIGSNAFAYCKNLLSVSMPNSVTSIGSSAFERCHRLEYISIPNSVVSIEDQAFAYCLALSSIIIPNSVTTIGGLAFWDCSNLSSVILPKNLKIIKGGLFRNCEKLKSIVIPSEVEYIYQDAFAWSGLEEVKVLAETPPFAYDNTFSNYQIPLYIPVTSIELYQTSSPWNKFASLKTIDGEDVQVKKCEIPNISYNNGEISFSCETEDVEFVSSIADSDIKNYTVAKIPLNVTYTINVRAKKAGYQDSDVATATLCWIDSEPQTEGVSSVTQVRSYSVMIQNDRGTLNIQGVNDGTPIWVYEANGKFAGMGISRNGKAAVDTDLQIGAIAVIKIGERSIKLVIR